MTERQRNRKLKWLAYHKRLIKDKSDFVICEKSRRVGWDYSHAYKKTMERLVGGCDRDLWYTSADESAAFEFMEYCKYFHQRYQTVVDYFEDHIEDKKHPKGEIKAFCIRMANGCRMNALSSSPRRLRSKGGDVSISEWAFHDDPIKLYGAAFPVATWGGKLEIGSTHNGEGSAFDKACRDAEAYARGERTIGGRKLTPWSYHHVDIFEAVEDGLAELINESKGTNFTRESFLEKCEAGCMTEDDWLQEYCCKPSTNASAWLPYDLIYTCEDAKCPQPGQPLWDFDGDGVRYAGIDVGRKKDLTVLWIVSRVGDVLWTRQVLVLEKMPIPQQVRIIAAALQKARVIRACVDATGIGMGIYDGLVELFGSMAIEEIQFTNQIKEKLAVPVRSNFEDRLVRIPDNSEVREGLHKIRKDVTAAGNVRFEAERTDAGHADEFWALALAMHAAGTASSPGLEIVDPTEEQEEESSDLVFSYADMAEHELAMLGL